MLQIFPYTKEAPDHVRAMLTISPLAASISTMTISDNSGGCPGSRPVNVTRQISRSSDSTSSASTLSGSNETSWLAISMACSRLTSGAIDAAPDATARSANGTRREPTMGDSPNDQRQFSVLPLRSVPRSRTSAAVCLRLDCARRSAHSRRGLNSRPVPSLRPGPLALGSYSPRGPHADQHLRNSHGVSFGSD